MIRDDSGDRDGWWIGDRFMPSPKLNQVWERGGTYYLIEQMSPSGKTLYVRRCARDGTQKSMYGHDMRTKTLFDQFRPAVHPKCSSPKEK